MPGIPYRRGYLLYGPPGSGKSSFIQSLAGSLNYDICLFNLSERGLTDDKLNYLMSNVPERSILLMEDVDAAFNKRVQTSEDGYDNFHGLNEIISSRFIRYQSAVTFSGFLNALDGVASGEERIIFLTTNHLERLDPALIRPGRVDLAMLIDDATPEQARRLFTQFYGGGKSVQSSGVDDAEIGAMGEQLEQLVAAGAGEGRKVSMAALQGLFIRNSPRDALQAALRLFAGP